ncbi:WSC domain-containing protein [Podospora aff. communis PSN243]|uniref:WSC domain-containing protein n=1 Tax=Podospora aff. communis PSN243 TaxID=3040156 RepID=A0AAV9GK27_9PEZI|nr:WSC domain-containing protein [Podospora aff. communis PSN243]
MWLRMLTLVFSLFVLLLSAAAEKSTPALTIYNETDAGYVYHGCYNETMDLPGTIGTRALYGGKSQVLEGTMTVPTCQNFCRSNGTVYKFAGLEYARECWCAQSLSTLSLPFHDSACSLPCEGDNTTACGGYLKISVYTLGASSARVVWSVGLSVVGFAILMNSL